MVKKTIILLVLYFLQFYLTSLIARSRSQFFFGPLEPEPEPLEKNTRSRSRLGKKSGTGAEAGAAWKKAGAEAAKKFTGSPALAEAIGVDTFHACLLAGNILPYFWLVDEAEQRRPRQCGRPCRSGRSGTSRRSPASAGKSSALHDPEKGKVQNRTKFRHSNKISLKWTNTSVVRIYKLNIFEMN